MEKSKALEGLTEAIIECKPIDETKGLVNEALNAGAEPLDIVDAVSAGLEKVGERYDTGEYFLMELTLAGNTAADIMDMIKPMFNEVDIPLKGKVVFGTVAGDLHYIGKDIVIAMLRSQRFNVIDLGVDVSVERFVSAVKEETPDVLAMSGLLTIVKEEMEKVIDALRAEGLKETVKVMIGGRAVSQQFADDVGADAFGATAVEAVEFCNNWVRGE
jgi:5-methyltetrahydrofolate--homocysteine methyltransferase